MADDKRIKWDVVGERFYETGVDRGVLYAKDDQGAYGKGVAWNGLTSVNFTPSGGEVDPKWADNIKYLNLVSQEEVEGSIEAYTYPEEFYACEGIAEGEKGVYVGQQARRGFGFSCRTLIGNDVDGTSKGYKIHIVWGALVEPTDKTYETVNDTPEAIEFSWDFKTTPVPFDSDGDYAALKPTAKIEIDSTKVSAGDLSDLEDLLYGVGATEPALPTPDQVLAIFTEGEG